MPPSSPPRAREYGGFAIVASVVVAAALIVHANADPIRAFIKHHAFWGVFLYLLLNIADAVAAPGATLPLIPVAARAWGRVPSALVTTIGWTLGSLLAFLIARRWGAPIVRKLTSLQRVQQMRRYVPEDLFWSIVLVRLVLPMDAISYVLGLFTEISWLKYVAATGLGIAPSALLLSYLGKLPHGYEIIAFGIGVGFTAGALLIARRKRQRHRRAPRRT